MFKLFTKNSNSEFNHILERLENIEHSMILITSQLCDKNGLSDYYISAQKNVYDKIIDKLDNIENIFIEKLKLLINSNVNLTHS